MRFLLLMALPIFLSGCAQYEYDLIQPPELARHVSADNATVIKIDPVEYHLQSADGRLVMAIYNPTPDAIELLGARSSAVDPDGQSHPLHDQTIAPGSYIKMIFPPLRPTIERTGPSFEFGLGLVHRIAYRYDDDRPHYLDVYSAADIYYWEWNGPGDLRLTIAFRRGDQTFQHAFAFRRVMK